MTKTAPQAKERKDASQPPKTLPTKEQYDAFISSLQLLEVRLIESSAKAEVRKPDAGDVAIEMKFEVKRNEAVENPEQFEAVANMKAAFTDKETGKHLGVVTVALGLLYRSEKPIDEGTFEIFSNLNVPLNAWPYLREHIQQIVTRFGWQAFVLPPYKTVSSSKPPEKAIEAETEEETSES